MLSAMRIPSMYCGRVALASTVSIFGNLPLYFFTRHLCLITASSRAFSSPTAAPYVDTPAIDLRVASRDSLDTTATDLLVIPYVAVGNTSCPTLIQ